MPSSQALAEAMAEQVDTARAGNVVELGAGTGIVTAALLDAGLAPNRLAIIERDRKMHQLLERRFPGAHTLLGDAVELKALLDFYRLHPVHTVVSSLPLLSLPASVRFTILEQVFDVLPADGALIQYTYGLTSPIPRKELRVLDIQGEPLGRIWKNIPPARVWRFTRAL